MIFMPVGSSCKSGSYKIKEGISLKDIMTNNLGRGFQLYQEEYEEKVIEVMRSGWYILGQELKQFEDEWAQYVGSRYCVGLASGLDALILAFRALNIGEGDEVIVQGNTYIASVIGITSNRAKPIFVEPDESFGIDLNKIEKKITKKTKAILVVHLYGIPCEMQGIVDLCKKYNLRLIEDCAQSHGAEYHGKMTGTFGDIGCFSFYPSKNLGAFGDAGAVVTDHEELADKIRILRNYGSEKRYYNKVAGVNSRLDELQAGLLRVKLRHLEELTQEREAIAARYIEEINNELIQLPIPRKECRCVWHQFVLQTIFRDELINYLKERKIGTIIHYPVPPHLAEAYIGLGYRKGDFPITERLADTVLSIPVYNGMTEKEIDYVVDCINKFRGD